MTFRHVSPSTYDWLTEGQRVEGDGREDEENEDHPKREVSTGNISSLPSTTALIALTREYVCQRPPTVGTRCLERRSGGESQETLLHALRASPLRQSWRGRSEMISEDGCN